jgi:thioesterase domain-containing protein/acyl carrier protein
MATGAAQRLIPGVDLSSDFYVPMSYTRILSLGPMPGRVFSHVRCLPDSGLGLAHFDVTLSDATGRVFAEISRFTMKRLDARSSMTAAVGGPVNRLDQRRNQLMDALLREAIAPSEGLAALDRIMAQPRLVQAVASSVDVLTWQERLHTEARPQKSLAQDAPGGFARPALATEYAAPNTETELALTQIFCELLGASQVGIHDDFFDFGGNSLIAVRLFAALKKRFRVSLPLSTLFEAPTIHRLAKILDAASLSGAEPVKPMVVSPAQLALQSNISSEPTRAVQSADSVTEEVFGDDSPLVPIQMAPGVAFFCVHGGGGNVLNFRDLARRLGDGQCFYGLQAKGVTGGEPANSIEEMASAYIAAIRGVRPHGPYVLGGYSGGGVVAYEMAQRLLAAGERVHLAFLDTFHPASRARAPSRTERLEYLVAEGTPYLWRAGRAKLVRTVEGFTGKLRIRYSQKRGAALPIELREQHITRAFDQAASRYVPKPYTGPVTLYRARTINTFHAHVGPTLGWGDVIKHLEIVEVPGNHETLMVEPNVAVVIRHLKELIGAAAAERSSVRADFFGRIDGDVAWRISR